MPNILPLGRVFETDAEGFLVNPASPDKIVPPWKEAVEAIKEAYLSHLGEAVHSIYVRGTVARGEAKEGVSDIDTFAVTTKKPEAIDRSWVGAAQKTLKARFPFAEGIEIEFIPLDELFYEEFFPDRFLIKTQSACIYGKDLAEDIAPFRPDHETARHLRPDLKKVFERVKKGLSGNTDREDIREWCRFAMKRMLRAGFLLVMEREQAFTRDLYPSYQLFSKHFPEEEENMHRVLELALEPAEDPEEVLELVNGLGAWLESAFAE
jgi:predicted nucleotidyltransferase